MIAERQGMDTHKKLQSFVPLRDFDMLMKQCETFATLELVKSM